MKVTYTPAGEAVQAWDFKPRLVRAGMAEMIEKRAGMRFEPWVNEVLAGSARARRVLLWHLMTLTHGVLRFEDTPDFAFGELEVERDLDEALAFRVDIENWKGDEDVRLQGLAEIDAEIEALRATGAEESPKATSPSGADATPSTSPPPSI